MLAGKPRHCSWEGAAPLPVLIHGVRDTVLLHRGRASGTLGGRVGRALCWPGA